MPLISAIVSSQIILFVLEYLHHRGVCVQKLIATLEGKSKAQGYEWQKKYNGERNDLPRNINFCRLQF